MTDLTVQYTPREMLDAMVQAPRPQTFLLDMLVRNTRITDKKYLEIDIVKGEETISPYVSRVGDPTPVGKKGYDTNINLAPYLYDQVTLKPGDTDTRLPGNTIYEGTSQGNADALTGQAIAGLEDRMIRREEQQLAEALRTGKQVISGDGTSYTVDYQMDAGNIVVLTGANLWNTGTQKIINNLQDWSTIVMEHGAPAPSVGITAVNVWNAMREDSDIQSLLDNRRTEAGMIEFRQNPAQRATYCGTLMGVGVNVDIWTYQGSYTSYATGTKVRTNYIPDDYFIYTSPQVRIEKNYSKIENFKAGFKAARFPNMWTEDSGKRKFVSLESGPLVSLNQPDGVISAKVL